MREKRSISSQAAAHGRKEARGGRASERERKGGRWRREKRSITRAPTVALATSPQRPVFFSSACCPVCHALPCLWTFGGLYLGDPGPGPLYTLH